MVRGRFKEEQALFQCDGVNMMLAIMIDFLAIYLLFLTILFNLVYKIQARGFYKTRTGISVPNPVGGGETLYAGAYE